MTRFSRLITARRFSLGLMLVIIFLLYVATIIPQQFDSTPEKITDWRQGHESILGLIDAARLHQIYSQPWFAVLVLCAALSLSVSSFTQLTIARNKLGAMSGGECLASSPTEDELRTIARSCGFRFEYADQSSGCCKFIKHPWGYFGIAMLHVGMTLVILTSSYIALTSRQGAVILIEGQLRGKQQSWDAAEHGVLSAVLPMPESIRLDKVSVDFDEKQQPSTVTSRITITDETGSVEVLTPAINRIQQYQGLSIYHSSQYGDAFTVGFTDRNGIVHKEQIAVQQPVGPAMPGYSYDFRVLWSPHQFSAKYFADREKKTMRSDNPELTLRMIDGGREIARTTLSKEGIGSLGEYRVDLLGVQKWSKLIFVDIKGMPIIFIGFAIIMLGGLLYYMTPPRELIGVSQPDGTCRVYWKATSFREFYLEERDGLQLVFKRGDTC